MNSRKVKDSIVHGFIYTSAAVAALILIVVVGFIFRNGWSLISMDFITRDFRGDLSVVTVTTDSTIFNAPANLSEESIFIESVGIELAFDDEFVVVRGIDSNSPTRSAIDRADNPFSLSVGQVIEGVNSLRVDSNSTLAEISTAFAESDVMSLRVRTLGGGVWPLIVSTLMLVVVTLTVAAPIGILAATYMVEYAKQGVFVNLVRFAVEILAGMPSIIYGLFGLVFFNRMLNMNQSIFTGALTLTILLLPILIRQTEEALKTVPISYREASYGLGANKIQTIFKIIMPSSLPGIMVGIILSIGRIVGETAALLFTLGGFARMPINMSTGNLSIFEQGATLTLRAYFEVQESANVEMAAGIGIVILVIVFALNMISKIVIKKFSKIV